MKKIVFIPLLMIFGSMLSAQIAEVKKDSTGKTEAVTIGANLFGGDYERSEFIFNTDLGINLFNDDGPTEFPNVKSWGSWNVQLMPTHKFHVAGPLQLKTSFGLSYLNYKFSDRSTRISEQGVVFNADPALYQFEKSKLRVTHAMAQEVITFDFGFKRTVNSEGEKVYTYDEDGFKIGIGAYGGYRLGAMTKYKFNDNATGGDRKHKNKTSDFNTNEWRYGLRGEIGFSAVKFFVNYDISELFENDGTAANTLGSTINGSPIVIGVTF